MSKKYKSLNEYFRERFGCRVHKITVDAGLTCPNRDGTIGRGGCIYCNARGSGSGAASQMTIKEQLLLGKQRVFRRYKAKKFLAYFQAHTNTYASIQTLASLYEQALSTPDIIGLCIGTRPDCVSDDILNLLQSYTNDYLIWMEYGLQSIHDKTLDIINRGHHSNAFIDAVLATQNRNILTCVHLILGLPFETRDHIIETAKAVAELPIDAVKLHLLYVVKDTPMEKLYRQGQYQCLYPSQYADWVCDVLERLPKTTIIQRLTGDPHPDELVAPSWAFNKQATLELIHKRLDERHTCQGRLHDKTIGNQYD
ncbi:MAG: TIGR01212 family radical SAM protein [Candidatus Magnetomorum sp.]|nr:TIGR01212 family radical SAM protein [Candidatus Magnetomorum sp.]